MLMSEVFCSRIEPISNNVHLKINLSMKSIFYTKPSVCNAYGMIQLDFMSSLSIIYIHLNKV